MCLMIFCSFFVKSMNLATYFDDDFADVYGGDSSKAKSKLLKVMTYVKEIYEERDTLQTILKINLNIEHKRGERWAQGMA